MPKEKKEKKDKASSRDGVHKSKKEKKHISEDMAEALVETVVDQQMADASDPEQGQGRIGAVAVPVTVLKAALVPFANPLADDKMAKKVLKGVKKSAKAKTLKRGVKEVVKSLRKSSVPTPVETSSVPQFVCVLAADISPMDVISHIPVLCEDHGVPYVFVTSRAELGAAGLTKRPTSVVLINREVIGKAAAKSAEAEGRSLEQVKEEWEGSYGDLVKVVRKAGRDVRV